MRMGREKKLAINPARASPAPISIKPTRMVTITDNCASRAGSPMANGAMAPATMAQVAASGPTINCRELPIRA
ncbi:hypothetical protein D3C76_1518830 [compost metagenome]